MELKIRKICLNLVLLGFLLGVYQGKVALWQDGKEKPIKVTPYKVTMFPEKDQQRLKNGIHVENLKELQELIEDYFS